MISNLVNLTMMILSLKLKIKLDFGIPKLRILKPKHMWIKLVFVHYVTISYIKARQTFTVAITKRL